MRTLIVGATSDWMSRVERVLTQHGWLVASMALSETESPTARRFDLVLLDGAGPTAALAAAVPALKRNSQAVSLMIFGQFTAEARALFMAQGVDDILPRQISSNILMARLTQQLRRRSQGIGDCFQLGDLSIDINRRRVRRGGKDMLLSQREYQLLLLLADASGAVLSRSAIIDHLSINDSEVGDNAVDALASRLRRRIDGPFGAKLLHTVRGVGYCLTAAS